MNITVQELKTKMDNKENIVLVDVREIHEHEEFNIGGHLIPVGSLPQMIPDLDIPQQSEIVVYCRSGNRSLMGQYLLKEAGFEDVYNLEGGMLAWREMTGE